MGRGARRRANTSRTSARPLRLAGRSLLLCVLVTAGIIGMIALAFADPAGVSAGGSTQSVQAAAPREVSYLCARGSNGLLRYVAGPGRCDQDKEDSLELAVDDPVYACTSEGSGKKVRRVADPTRCSSKEAKLTLPGEERVDFCAAKEGGRLRHVEDAGDCARREIPVFVPLANRAPVSDDDSYAVDEDQTLDVAAPGVLDGDTDAENDPLTVVLVDGPANAESFAVNPDGSFGYEPKADFNGADTFTYKPNDGNSDGSTATVTVTVDPVNDTPVANDDGSDANPAATTQEDTATGEIDVLSNDAGLGDKPIGVAIETDGAKGAVTVNPDSTVTYTPDPDANGPDSFVYEVCDGDATPECDTATVHLEINPVDDQPDAVDDGSTGNPAATTDEDAPAGGIGVLSNDAGLGDGPVSVTIETQGTKGAVTVNPDSTVTYTPDPDANGPDSFVYEVCDADTPTPDCDTATVHLEIDPKNDAPVVDLNNLDAGNDSTAEFLEETGAPVELAPNADVTDVDNNELVSAAITLTNRPDGDTAESLNADVGTTGIAKNYNPSSGILTLTGVALKADYQQVLRTVTYDNTATPPDDTDREVEFTVNDGAVDSTVATATVTVTPDNEPPVVDLNGAGAGTGYTAAFTEDGGAVSIVDAANLTVTDADDTNIESATVTLANRLDGADESLSVDLTGTTGITATAYDPTTGELALSGTATNADYEQALRTVEYDNTSNTPDTANRSVEFVVNDGQDDSDTATSTVSVAAADDPPVAVADPATVNEDSGANAIDVLANDTDADGGTNSVESVTQPANGTVVITGGGTGLDYEPNSNYCNDPGAAPDDTFTYTLNGGSDATVSVTITCFEDDPVAVADSATVNEDSGANAIDVLANDTDVDGGTKSVESVTQPVNGTVVITGGGTGLDYEPNSNYCNDPPGTTPDTFTYTLNGGSDAAVSVKVTCVDDQPVAVDDSATVLEDAAATSIDVLTNDTDVDAGPKTIASAGDPANGTVTLTGGSPGVHTGLTYRPDPNYCNDPPGTTPDTFTYTLNGGSNATVSMTVTCVNDAPVADDETFNGNDSAHGNTAMVVNDPDDGAPDPTHPNTTVTGDILAGDTDVDGPSPLTVTPGTFATDDGGSVAIESDGDFTFHPAAGTSCTDTDTSDFFDYTIEDSGSPEQTDTGRVTINIVGCVWYVSNNAVGNSGTSQAPFDTLAQAETASGANHTVFVFDGDNTDTDYATGYAMNSGERLIGEHEGLTVDPDQGGALTADSLHPANPGVHPTVSALNEDVVDLDDGNEIRGFIFDPGGTGGGIFGGSGDTGGGTIDDVVVLDNDGTVGQQPALELDGTTGTFNISGFVVSNKATGVRLNNAGTVDFAGDTSQIALTSDGGPALTVSNTSLNTSQFDDITVTNSSTGGVDLDNVTGTTVLGDGVDNDIRLTTTSGSEPALDINSGGSVSLGAAGIDELHATGGPALDVTSTSGAALDFDDVDSTNSASDGINLDGLGTGTFSAVSGDIKGATGISFDLNGGSGTVTYPGGIGDPGAGTNDGTGDAAEITGRTGGSVTLSGSIDDDNDPGGGVRLTGNSGGSTTLSGSSKKLDTGTANALTMGTSDGHTLSVSGGGLDIDTTSGKGLEAGTSGTLGVGGTGNTITTGTGTALNVTNTDIASGGLTFEGISASGAASGIVLNNTGPTGRLVVGPSTGGACESVATCAGGAIQNPTGPAISLTNTRNVSLTEMYILNGATHGISGTTMTDASGGVNPTFELRNSFLESPGDFDNESAIFFDALGAANITGRLVVSDTTIQNFEDVGLHVGNNAGTLTADVTNVTFNNNSDNNGEEGIDFAAQGTANMNLNVDGSTTFTDLEGGGLDVASENSADVDLNINGATVTGTGGPDNFPTPPAMTFVSDGASSTMTFDITNNDIIDSSGDGIFIGHEGAMMGRVTGNDVSNIATGDGLRIDTDATGSNTSTILVNNNNFGNVAGNTGIGDDGIQVLHRDGTKTLNLDIQNNQIRNTNSEGIRYFTDDDVSGGGPGNVVRVSGNQFGNNGSVVDPADSIAMVAQDAGTDLCTHITGNTTVEGITLQQSSSAVLRITQASTAALASANGGATVTSIGTITFSAPCTSVPQPTNQ